MKVFRGVDEIDIFLPVVTIGTFDGVHVGHQKIIHRLNNEARKCGGESTLFTFFPHPRMVIYPETHGLKLLQSLEEKLEKLEQMGLQNVILFPFDFEFSRMSAIAFVRDMLVNKLHIHKLVIGYDHQFGRNREGTIDFLKNSAESYDFQVIEIPAAEVDEVNVSSTKIREFLRQGSVEKAAEFLGKPYALKGKVVKGDQLGRSIGYPTANLDVIDAEKLIPAAGVYVVSCTLGTERYYGMMNIGVRPTVSHQLSLRLEVHLLDFSKDIYGHTLELNFIRKIRDEIKFPDLASLGYQLTKDEKFARAVLLDTAE